MGKKETTKSITKKGKKNSNLKSGYFTKDELNIYSLEQKEVDIILEYQEKLPILQQDNSNWINARELHKQLQVSKDCSTWIKQQIEELEPEEEIDYYYKWLKDGVSFKEDAQYSPQKMVSLGYTLEYFLKVELAKEISMIAGTKGGRTNQELKDMSKLARKYFIYIEKAFKARAEWNSDRMGSIECFHELVKPLKVKSKELTPSLPEWSYGNTYMAEMAMLNEIIIGMSATQYRKQNGLKKSDPVRNKFNKLQLYFVHKLEIYDSTLIEIQEMYNYNERKKILIKYFDSIFNKLNVKIA